METKINGVVVNYTGESLLQKKYELEITGIENDENVFYTCYAGYDAEGNIRSASTMNRWDSENPSNSRDHYEFTKKVVDVKAMALDAQKNELAQFDLGDLANVTPKILKGEAKLTEIDDQGAGHYDCRVLEVENADLFGDLYITFHALDAEGKRVSWSVCNEWVSVDENKALEVLIPGDDFKQIIAVFSHGPVFPINESACVILEK